MPFNNSYDCTSQSIRIPLRIVDAVHGRGNHDDAGDVMIYCLRTICDSHDQYETDFAIDTSHDNPWYHAMVYTIHDITGTHYNQFIQLLSTHKLVEA